MIKRGIHQNLGMEEYHAWKLDKSNLKAGPISTSMLKEFARNPYAWLRAEPKEPTPAMQTGSLLDMALTEVERFEESIALSPFDSYRTKEARAWRDEVLAQGKIVATKEQAENALSCAEAVWEHDEAASILERSTFQTGVVTEVGGIPFKCLIDILPQESEWEEIIWDYKTTSAGLDDESLRKTIGQFKYHWQAAAYKSAWNKESKDRHCERFGFIFQDPQTREVRVVVLDDDSMELGRRGVVQALAEVQQASIHGIKSRYQTGRRTLGVPAYVAMQEEDQLISLEDVA
jgi:hypothetical protein